MELLVTYDVDTGDRDGERRLVRVARICESYGVRVQKSVFEFRLNSAKFEALVGELLDAIDPVRDSVTVYRFPGVLAESRTSLGRPLVMDTAGPWIV
jgi:CRISPR-associated protein Cas2